MNHLMNNMKNIPGVVGVAIFKDDGNLVAFDFPEAYDKSLLSLVGLKFQPIKEILPHEEGEIVYLCWEFENFLGFYYPVNGGWVNIISGEDIPMPVFTLTMTAVASKLPKLLESAQGIGDKEHLESASAENIVSKTVIEEVEKAFSLYIGPAAHVILKRVAHHQGYTLSNIPKEKLAIIIYGVVAKVPDDKKDEAMAKVKKFY